MKKYYYLFILFLVAFSSKAQIVNSQFENWTIVTGYDSLDNWITDAAIDSSCVTKETVNTQSGNASLKLTNSLYTLPSPFNTPISLPGAASTGGTIKINIFPLSASLDLSQGGQADSVRHNDLKGYYKFIPAGVADTGFIGVFLFKRNGGTRDTIAWAIKTITTAATSYTAFDLPLTYLGNSANPDTSIIYFQSGGSSNASILNTATVGSSLYIDSIYYDGITGIHELPSGLVYIIAYPNPASEILTIESKWKSFSKSNVTVSILDINGKLMQRIPLEANKQRIDISSYVSGSYIYQLVDEKGARIYSGKFSVSH